MKGSSVCYFKPYIRPSEKEKGISPYITRLVPHKNGFTVDYMDKAMADCSHVLYVREYKTENDFEMFDIPYGVATISSLQELCEYEFYIENKIGGTSCRRIVKTGKDIDGAVVVDYLHPEDKAYDFSGRTPCAPSIVKLPSGDLYASAGIFVDRNEFPALPCLTKMYRSKDEGLTWQYEGDLLHSFNGSLFLHKDKLYFLGLRGDYDDVIILCSEDEGKSWSAPITLFHGETAHRWGWHTSAMHPVVIKNRLYKAIEYGHVEIRSYETTGKECFMADKYYDMAHHLGVLSVEADDDLMKPECWSISELYYPEDIDPYQCIEGNIVDGPDGIVNILRTIKRGVSLKMKVDENDPEGIMYDPEAIEDFPLSAISKFEIKKDPVTGRYVAIGNHWPYSRQVLVMAVSDDLKEWKIACNIKGDANKDEVYSYVDFIFSDDDILLLSRTGYNGNANQHDTNMITFHKIADFRQYI